MGVQVVMDRTGDTRHEFNHKNAEAVAEAAQRFKELTGVGFTPAIRENGQTVLDRQFHPDKETLFIPRIIGG